jgi:hypothetical protein
MCRRFPVVASCCSLYSLTFNPKVARSIPARPIQGPHRYAKPHGYAMQVVRYVQFVRGRAVLHAVFGIARIAGVIARCRVSVTVEVDVEARIAEMDVARRDALGRPPAAGRVGRSCFPAVVGRGLRVTRSTCDDQRRRPE